MEQTNRGILHKIREKLRSPAYLAVLTIGIIILGNLFRYLDNTFGTHLDKLNPVLVLLVIILFVLYIYNIRDVIKNRRRG